MRAKKSQQKPSHADSHGDRLRDFGRGRTIDRSVGSVVELVASSRRLKRSERALLKLLKRKAA
jgi:predicted methyltransferase MtxX (methanogen marker protein 4)